MRRLAAVLTVAFLLAACGQGSAKIRLHVAHSRFAACASADCGYAVTLSWSPVPLAGRTGYNLLVGGTQVGTAAGSPYTFTGLGCGTTFTLGVQAHDSSGNVSQTYSISYSTPGCVGVGYDAQVLADGPVAYYAMSSATTTEADLTGNGHTGTYHGVTAALPTTTMPNGDTVNVLNHGQGMGPISGPQDMTVEPDAVFSEPTTGFLTVVAWVNTEDVRSEPLGSLAASNGSNCGTAPNTCSNLTNFSYFDFAGKCPSYSTDCEWDLREYGDNNHGHESPNRSNRFSGYICNSGGGLCVSADWQPQSNCTNSSGTATHNFTGCSYLGNDQVVAGNWYMVVAEYDAAFNTAWYPGNPAACNTSYGSDFIWLNGVPWSQTGHSTTGCYSQHTITPTAVNPPNAACSPTTNCQVHVGDMTGSLDGSYWVGSIAKFAVFDKLLSQADIDTLFTDMAGVAPTGTCANATTGDSQKNDCTLGAQVP